MDSIPKFKYLKELTQLISGITVVHTDILRFFQYCDETHACHYKCMIKCNAYVPITRINILYNCNERSDLLTERAWSKLKEDMVNMKAGMLEASEIKYITSLYIFTYKTLRMVKEECSRIMECDPIVNVLLKGNTTNWIMFTERVPKIIDFCYENWQSLNPDVDLGTVRPCVIPTMLQEWKSKVAYYTTMLTNGEAVEADQQHDSTDSEGEPRGLMPREERRTILSRSTPRKHYPHQ